MQRYDPLVAMNPEEWLALAEAERIRRIEDYHRRARIRLPNAKLHATLHAVVENQAALGDEIPVRRTLQRLMREGIDRHEAIHAIAMVLAAHLSKLAGSQPPVADPNPTYFAELDALTVEGWRREYGTPS